jgi:hypothetical protein
MSDQEIPKQASTSPYRRTSDFRSVYANNIFFETTVFDIRAIFGEISPPTPELPGSEKVLVEQHTSIRMSWLEAKIFAIFLAINVSAHEERHGPITIPEEIRPPFVTGEEADLPIPELLQAIVAKQPKEPPTPAG